MQVENKTKPPLYKKWNMSKFKHETCKTILETTEEKNLSVSG
jgi:hypothetical protein